MLVSPAAFPLLSFPGISFCVVTDCCFLPPGDGAPGPSSSLKPCCDASPASPRSDTFARLGDRLYGDGEGDESEKEKEESHFSLSGSLLLGWVFLAQTEEMLTLSRMRQNERGMSGRQGATSRAGTQVCSELEIAGWGAASGKRTDPSRLQMGSPSKGFLPSAGSVG